ncbi:hypothetical protein NH340_JMT08722 [Sarcoptes scabiei]|nr:hypothetical protein NH340_JMT08722 [Sarcoptes scabiei]
MMYCDRHYGYCDYFRSAGDLCRHDSQCDGDLICMFGRCEVPSKSGQKGARCNHSDDCLEGLCCARQHGERICKPKLKLGQQCFVPLGGLDYSLNELCPCDQGLECRTIFKGKISKRKRNNVMRCLYQSTSTTTTTIATPSISTLTSLVASSASSTVPPSTS